MIEKDVTYLQKVVSSKSNVDNSYTQPSSAPEIPEDVKDNANNSHNTNLPYHPHSRQLRYLISPLSKEQLINILIQYALVYEDLYQRCMEEVRNSIDSKRLLVKNIPQSVTDEAYRNFFSEFGDIEDSLIVKDNDGRSKGYGFISFKHMDSVMKCFASDLILDNRELRVKLVTNHLKEIPQTNVFISNLPPNITSEELRQFFVQYGNIQDCTVITDNTGKCKGYGFVTFENSNDALKVVHQSEILMDERTIFANFSISYTVKMRRKYNIKYPRPAHAYYYYRPLSPSYVQVPMAGYQGYANTYPYLMHP